MNSINFNCFIRFVICLKINNKYDTIFGGSKMMKPLKIKKIQFLHSKFKITESRLIFLTFFYLYLENFDNYSDFSVNRDTVNNVFCNRIFAYYHFLPIFKK